MTIALAIASTLGCSKMNKERVISKTDAIKDAAGRVASRVLPDEVAETFPLPLKSNGRDYFQILYYREAGPPGKRIVHAPHYCMRLDAYTAEVVRFWNCTPDEIGIGHAPPFDPPGIREGMTAEEFVEKDEQLASLSPHVARLFFDESTDLDLRSIATVKEYFELLLEINSKDQATFMINASPDFFSWLISVKAK